MAPKDRSRLLFKIRYAVEHPDHIAGYARRRCRDTWLRLQSRDHLSYYRAVMASDSARSHDGAVGSRTHDSWIKIGQMQFDYLDAGNYFGIDISPDILLAATDTVAEYRLQAKLPHLTLVRDMSLGFLPDGLFSVVHAHSVFSHSPIGVIDECLRTVRRVMAPDGFFDFTFDRTEGPEHHVLHEDFYYRTETLIALAAKHGLRARFMDDWESLPHEQSKLRVTRGV